MLNFLISGAVTFITSHLFRFSGGILLSTSAKGEREKQWNNCIQNPGYEFEQWHKLEVVE